MPRVKLAHAITTRDSIANLWALAEVEGLVVLFPKSRKDAFNIRNKLYAHRSRQRKAAQQHTGFAATPLDHFSISYGSVRDCPTTVPPNTHPHAFYLTISRQDVVELTVAKERVYYHAPMDDFVYKAKP